MRNASAVSVIILALAGPAQAFEWRAKVSHCAATRGEMITRHLRCDRDPIVAPCGKIQTVGADLGGLAQFEVLWHSGARSEVLIGPHEGQYCIVASRWISGPDMASAN